MAVGEEGQREGDPNGWMQEEITLKEIKSLTQLLQEISVTTEIQSQDLNPFQV